MEKIEVVIKISEDVYRYAKKYREREKGTCMNAIGNGTPLPKGHGKIGDLTKLYNKIDKRNRENGKGKYTGILVLVDNAETIIEADKGENE